MSTDFEDPRLDELLAGYARSWNAGFVTPPLAGMLEQATSQPDHRRRWLLAAVAAVLLLAIPVATVLVLHRDRTTTQPAGRVTERSLGPAPWDSALLLADSTVAVQVATNVPCGQPVPIVRASVTGTTPTTITITASRYVRSDAQLIQPAPGFSSCANSPDGNVTTTATVRITGLAGRKLVDGATGEQRQVLDTAAVASPSFVPKGFVDDGFSWSEVGPAHQLNVQHSYHNPKGTLTVNRLSSPDPIGDKPVGGTTVGPIHGHTGQWLGFGRLSWESGGFLWTIDQVAYNGTGKVQVDLKTALKIANSLP